MRLDHLCFAAGPEGLEQTAADLGGRLGARFLIGGNHPRFGTRNQILPLAGGRYLEVVEVLDHPAADKAAFGQAVRGRTAQGGGWLGWAVATDDLGPIEQRLGQPAVAGSRRRPDGTLLEWRLLGINGLRVDPQLPFFVCWDSPAELHPSAGGSEVELVTLEISGDSRRVDRWLGGRGAEVLADLHVEWNAPHGQPGIDTALFRTPNGDVRI